MENKQNQSVNMTEHSAGVPIKRSFMAKFDVIFRLIFGYNSYNNNNNNSNSIHIEK